MSGIFNLRPNRMKKLQKVFAWVSILSLVLQISSGVFLYRPVLAEEEIVPPETTVEETVTPPAEEPTGEPTIEPGAEPTQTIEVIPTETPAEPPADPNLVVNQGSQKLGLDLGPSETDETSAQLKPSISTDKDDYAPEETVTISGSNFPASIDVLIKVTWPDGIVRDSAGLVDSSDTITTDEEGSFTYLYSLRGEGQEGEYLVEVFQGETVLATKIFTDTVDKVTICHATASHSNPYTVNQPNKTADVQGHDGHNGPIWYSGITIVWGDIIPPFDYSGGSYPGKNWTTEGQAIWNNDCEILPPEPVCGNGQMEGEEECDDGNTDDGDGCSANCAIEEEECVEGPTWADELISDSQGTLYSGGAITDPIRTDPQKTLGAADGNFYSLGLGGEIILKFSHYIENVSGDDLSVHETTWNRIDDIEEKAEVYVSNNGSNWLYLGEASSFSDGDGDTIRDGVTYFDFDNLAEKPTWINYVKLVESSVGQAGYDDGFDLDAVDGVHGLCEEPGDHGTCGNGVVEENEQCDDGNQNNDDYCSNDCQRNSVCLPDVNMLVNGGFEIPVVTHAKGWDIYDSGTAGLGWTVEWYDGDTSYGDQTRPEPAHLELQRAVKDWVDFEGEQYAELDSDWDGPDGGLNGEPASISIYQDLPTVAGYQYQIDFAYSPRPDTVASNNELEFSWDGDVKAVLSQAGGSNTNWTPYSYTFTATGGVTRIRFTDVGDVDSFGPFLDDVSVICLGIEQECGNGQIEGDEVCDGEDGITEGENFCTSTCQLVPIYDGNHACPPNTTPVKITENPLVLSSTSSTLVQFLFENGKEYLLEASGVYSYNKNAAGNLADPAYGTRDNWSSLRNDIGIWGTNRGVTSILGNLGSGMGVIEWDDDQQVNGDHIYRKAFTPSAEINADFVISDWYGDWYGSPYDNQSAMGDNNGNLALNVYECQPTSDVTVCKYDDSGAPLSGWNVSLKGDLIKTVNVLPDGSDYNSSLLGEDDYVLEASGYYTYRPGTAGAEYTDANYSKRHPSDAVYGGPYVPWVNVNSFPAPHTGWLGVMVNGSATNWSDYFNPEHIYTLGYPNYSGNFSFKILDDNYSDNSGQIPVKIYHGYAGTTGIDGCVTFEDVPYGSYLLDEVLKDNWVNSSGKGSSVVVDESQETFTLFNRENYGSISGMKYEDKNGNGSNDGELGLPDWTIFLDANGNGDLDGSETSTLTDSNGNYVFNNLLSGTYKVCEVSQAGWIQTSSPKCYEINVSGDDHIGKDFGNFELGYIQGRKYEDLNQNGSRQSGEAWLPGWTINLYDADWNFIASTTTAGGNGIYRFEDLDIGIYYTCEVLQEGWAQTGPTLGGNRVANQSPNSADEGRVCWKSPFNQSGQSRTGRQFGNVQYGDITVCKYDDYNGNGFFDEGEPGILGVTINLFEETLLDFLRIFDGDGEKPIDSCETNETGCCTFENLSQGDYRVEEDLNDPELAGYEPTSDSSVKAIVNPGQETLVNFFNTMGEIGLDLTKSNSVSGSTVTYTLTVRNNSKAVAHNVKVYDRLPLRFTYNMGTTKINGASSADPAIFGQLLTWSLGDLGAEDTVVITYDVTIGSLPFGFYPNVAFVWGANRDPCDPDFCSSFYSDFAYSIVAVGGGFSTTTHIGGTVLGAATEVGQVLGAATGSDTLWLVLALMMILAGVTVMFITKKKRGLLLKKLARFGKKFSAISCLLFLISYLFIFSGSVKAIDSLFIRVADLPEYKSTDNFELFYTTLEREDKPISVVCYVEKDGGFGWKTFGGTQTDPAGSCEVFGHELEGDATYRFKAIATSADGSTESNITQTIIDRSGPESPRDYRKSRKTSMTYEIHWRNPDNADYSFTRVFTSTERNFTADDSTKKEDIPGGPNQEFDYVFGGFDPDKEYFFALQGFDKAGNSSGLSGDGGTVTYEEVLGETVSPTPIALPVVSSLPVEETAEEAGEEGQILGGEAEEEISKLGLLGGLGESATEVVSGLGIWKILGLVGVGGGVIGLIVYLLKRR